jgi:hypothetical protein
MSETEEKAAKMGWVPQEEWKGDPEKWRPAEEFVERGENIVPIMRERIEKLEKELEVISKLNKSELKKVRESAYEQAKKEYEKELETLNKEKFEAIQEADVEKYQQVEGKISKLKKPDEIQDEVPQVNPVFEDWRKKNSWYAPDLTDIGDADEALTLFANAIGGKIQAEKPGMPPEEFFAEVEKRVRAEFPHKFENPKRKEPGLAESGHQSASKSKKSFADLPDDAKSAYRRIADRMKSKGREYNKEDYAKAYFEED